MTLRLNGSTSGYTEIDAPAVAGSNSIVLPSGNGSANQFLKNGSTAGTLGWSSMVEDSSGRLLVGTSSAPSLTDGQYSKLHIIGNTNSASGDGFINIGRGALASSGLTVGTSLGNLQFTDSAGAVHAAIGGLTDGTTGTNDYPGRLVFSTTADGASSPTERMRIDSNGIIFTRDAISATFYANTNTDFRTFTGAGSNTGGVSIESTTDSTSARFHFSFSNPNGVVGSISTSASATSFTTSSDYRLKENITPVTDGISRLRQLKPARFNFIADPAKTVDGFLAHEVQSVVPEAIAGEKDAVDEDGNPIYQGIDQSKLVPLLTAALQEAIAKIESLETRLAALEAN